MSDPLRALLNGSIPAAVYRWPTAPPGHASAAVDAPGWRSFLLDGQGVHDRGTFLAACVGAFELPDWFGRNWDALWDCLTDLSWAPAPAYLLIYDHWGEFAASDPGAWATARTLLIDASRYWQQDRQTPFAVLLTGDGPDEDLPALPGNDEAPGGEPGASVGRG